MSPLHGSLLVQHIDKPIRSEAACSLRVITGHLFYQPETASRGLPPFPEGNFPTPGFILL